MVSAPEAGHSNQDRPIKGVKMSQDLQHGKKIRGVGGHGQLKSVMCLRQKHEEMLKRPNVARTSVTPELGLQRGKSPGLPASEGIQPVSGSIRDTISKLR